MNEQKINGVDLSAYKNANPVEWEDVRKEKDCIYPITANNNGYIHGIEFNNGEDVHWFNSKETRDAMLSLKVEQTTVILKAYEHLVKKALFHDFRISVYDGDEWAVKKSNNEFEILDCIKSVDESELHFHRNIEKAPWTDKVGWAKIILGNNDITESVADHNCYDEDVSSSIKYKWLDDWSDEFDQYLNEQGYEG